MNHRDVVKAFEAGKTKATGCNMFVEGDTMYSYGRHFQLMVRMPWGNLMNGDKYSVSTSKHQSYASRIATIIIPFSVLRNANIHVIRDIELIHKEAARYDKRVYIDKDGQEVKINERRPEGAVVKYGGRYFLSSMDGNNYFMSELPREVKTVTEAFESLKPEMANGDGVLRQGEWFFYPVNFNPAVKIKYSQADITNRQYIPMVTQSGNIRLKNRIDDGNTTTTMSHHYATEYGLYGMAEGDVVVVRGTVRHINGDHRMLKLGDGKQWYRAVESNHVRSWGAQGRVD